MLSPDERAGTRPSRAKAAESLIRSLVGVADARVGNGNGRIDNIRIVPRGNASPQQITRNVASAIMAHFGQAIDPAAITIQAHLVETERNGNDPQDAPAPAAPNGRHPNGHAASNGGADHSPNGSDQHDDMTRPHDGVSNGQRSDAIRLQAEAPAPVAFQPAASRDAVRQPNGATAPAAANPSPKPVAQQTITQPNGSTSRQPINGRSNEIASPAHNRSFAAELPVHATSRAPVIAAAHAAHSHPGSAAGDSAPPAHRIEPTAPTPSPAHVSGTIVTRANTQRSSRPRLDSIEITNVERGLRCRVSLSLDGETYSGIGDGPDRPADLTDLAARVTIDALRAARCPRQPMQLEGTATTTVGGQVHVVTAVAVWNGTDFDRVSGAQPVSGSPAEAAALSVIRSVTERMHSNA